MNTEPHNHDFVVNKAKRQSQKGGNKKAKQFKFSEKRIFLTP